MPLSIVSENAASNDPCIRELLDRAVRTLRRDTIRCRSHLGSPATAPLLCSSPAKIPPHRDTARATRGPVSRLSCCWSELVVGFRGCTQLQSCVSLQENNDTCVADFGDKHRTRKLKSCRFVRLEIGQSAAHSIIYGTPPTKVH